MNLRQTINGVGLQLKKAAPDIMFAAGIALSAVSVIEFCKKSDKGLPVAKQFKENVQELSEEHSDGAYNDKTYCTLVAEEAVKAGKELGKIYWKPAVMWVASTALVAGSHYILKDRNATLTIIASGLGAELKTLHQRIIERYGEDVDKELKFGTETKEIETRSIDEETGEEVVNKSVVPVNNGGFSLFARYYDEACIGWRNNAELNKSFLLAREAEANRRLDKQGYLFLNDVYEMLGMKKTRAGQKVGWKKNSRFGDGYVSFGIFNTRQGNRDFVNGYQPIVLLDFNVDGEIIDAMPDLDIFGNVIG